MNALLPRRDSLGVHVEVVGALASEEIFLRLQLLNVIAILIRVGRTSIARFRERKLKNVKKEDENQQRAEH
jgi:hypothetical protein